MSGLRAALEELHFLDESVPGFRVCDNDEHTWPCDTARLVATYSAVDREALTEILAAHKVGRHLPPAEAIAAYRAVVADAVLALINQPTKQGEPS